MILTMNFIIFKRISKKWLFIVNIATNGGHDMCVGKGLGYRKRSCNLLCIGAKYQEYV